MWRKLAAVFACVVLAQGTAAAQSPPPFQVFIEAAADREGLARAGVELLQRLRADPAVRQYEWTCRVRIAPGLIPHSHPILTLNTRSLGDPDSFLSVYLHEQMHWYLTMGVGAEIRDRALAETRRRYPELLVGLPHAGQNAYSSLVHIIVNWLEIEATASVIGRERALAAVRRSPVYATLYSIVIAEADSLREFYTGLGLWPHRPGPGCAP